MKITIKNQEIELKSTMRSILIYEQITDKVFSPANMSDMLIYFYSVILASNKDIEITFEELIDAVDEDPTLFQSFNNFLQKTADKNKLLATDSKKKENQ